MIPQLFTLVSSLAISSVIAQAPAPAFTPPATSPESVSTSNYVGASNSTLTNGPVVPGKVFDRFIQIWLENTDFNDAASSKIFQTLHSQGILLNQYYAVTHPSEPNYCATVGGDFFGMHDDALYNMPTNISTIVDLLEAKNISWGAYQENLPSDGFSGFNFSSTNYLNASAPPYVYYVRKHNPLILYETVNTIPSRVSRIRNFNDFAADLNASAIPQWSFITPNMVNDGHDTNIDFSSDWVNFWLVPLLKDSRFNGNKTLILLTFDENEHSGINNQIYTLLLGTAVPDALHNTTDSTYYTHYSPLSTVQANWGLGSLGRFDTNVTMSNVYSLVANKTGYKNVNLSADKIPLTNSSGNYAGALNAQIYIPFLSPNTTAKGAGGGPVFIANGTNTNLTLASAPAPVNLTASNASAIVPASEPTGSSGGGSTPKSGAESLKMKSGLLGVGGMVMFGVGLML